MEIKKIDGLILRSFPYSETSQIVHLLSEDGKSAFLAKGANRPKSKFRGKLQPLFRVMIIVHRKESRAMDILGDVEIINPHLGLVDDFDKSIFGNAIIESAYQLFNEGELIGVEYEETITALDKLNRAVDQYIDIFFIYLHQIITHSGFNLSIDHCRQCGERPNELPVFFDINSGDYLCGRCLSAGNIPANMNPLRLQAIRGFAEKRMGKKKINREDGEKILNFYLAYIRNHWKSDFVLKSLELLNYGNAEV